MTTTRRPVDRVSIGPTTIGGGSVSLAALLIAVVAFLSGDRSEQTLGTIVFGLIGLVTGAIVLIGRYLQARTKLWPDARNADEVAELVENILVDHRMKIEQLLAKAVVRGDPPARRTTASRPRAES